MQDQLLLSSGLSLNQDGKIIINPKGSRVKIDVGLSYCAPYSNLWLSKLSDCVIFGFEPNTECVEAIKTGKGFETLSHYRNYPEKTKDRLFVIPCALDNIKSQSNLEFYIASSDPGVSSLYSPVDSAIIKEKVMVPCISLTMFLDRIDWSQTRGYIDHLKIDAQGNDFRILKSAGKYLTEKIVYVTIEAGDERFFYHCDKEDTNYTQETITEYMIDKGFVKVMTPMYSHVTFDFFKKDFHRYNLTFFNTKFFGEDINQFDCSLLYE